MTTPKGLPVLAEGQATPETTVNKTTRMMEAGACHFAITDRLTTPPGTCADGAAYIITATATGLWASKEGQIAIALGTNAASGWYYRAAVEGFTAWVQDEDAEYRFDGAAWAVVAAASGLPAGGATGQVLAKQSASDGDADWATLASVVGPSLEYTVVTPADTTLAVDLGTDFPGSTMFRCDWYGWHNTGTDIFQHLRVSDDGGATFKTGATDYQRKIDLIGSMTSGNLIPITYAAHLTNLPLSATWTLNGMNTPGSQFIMQGMCMMTDSATLSGQLNLIGGNKFSLSPSNWDAFLISASDELDAFTLIVTPLD